ncbi:MAG: mechanosensitive ion channel family protein [Desulfobacterota bacterium]|nr:mechanosensitive ion channel family protein [Thermodesulfobacteriota bacterium]
MAEIFKSFTSYLTAPVMKIGGILAALLVITLLSRWIEIWIERFVSEKDPLLASEAKKRAHTLGSILRHALLILLVFVAALMILGELGIQVGPLLATAGIGALAIGFGAQSLVKDVISGFFIIFENQYRIGDVIEVSGVSGLVESVSLRKTVLRDLQGRVHFIPNGEIKVVSNLSKEWSRVVLDLGVSYQEDIDQIMEILTAVGRELESEEPFKSAILEPLQILGVERFDESQMVIRMMVKTAPLKQWDVGRELRRRIKKRFDELGLQLPYPHRVLLWGEPLQKGGERAKTPLPPASPGNP